MVLFFRMLVLLTGLLLSAVPAAYAQHLDQIPGPNSPAGKEQVQLLRPAPDMLIGRVTIPDPKAAVLIQPEGRDWREFRNVTLRIVATVLIVGMVVLLALFFLKRGTVELEHGRSGRTVTRFTGVERFAHWTTAVSFLVLALTGLAVLFGRLLLIPVIGHGAFFTLAHWSKLAHNFFGVPFVVGLVLIVVLWLRDNLPEKADWVWLRCGGGLFARGGFRPETGKFNAGQKLVFWSVVLGGTIMAVTGFLLLVPFRGTGIEGMQWVHMAHAVLAALLTALILGHIYIGTVGMEGAFDAMGSGEVDENWAREHHERWYQEEKRRTGDGGGGRAAGAD